MKHKLIIQCDDESLLRHLLRGLVVDLHQMDITTKSAEKRRAIREAVSTARLSR